tara:strand:- start:1862 stop:3172 length:1311 start_codon:yes stop_codon:yes gene_type:complete
MKKYKAYKDSGIEWIGVIPEHWNLKPLKHIVECNSESLPENTPKNQLINYIEIGDVSAGQGITGFEKYEFEKAPSRARRIVREGDVIISTVRTYLKAIASIERQFDNYVVSTGFAVLTPKQFDSTYLNNIVLSNGFIGEIISLSKGISYPSITSSDLLQIKVPFPSTLEQEDIGAYLDQKTTEIDTLITKKEQLIKLLEEERTAMINQAVTKGLDPNVPMKDSGIDWLGEIPEHWVLVKLKYLTRIRYGLGQPPKQKEGGLPIIRATNVYRGTISEENMIYVDPDDLPLNREPILKENDIIVVRSGAYTADSAIIEKKWEGTVTGYDLVMTPKTVNPKLLSFALLSTYMLDNQLFLQRLRAAQPHLNSEELGNTFMLLPPDFEQIDLVDFIENELLRLNEIKEKVKKEIHFLKEYKTALISEVVTGKIDVREEVLN